MCNDRDSLRNTSLQFNEAKGYLYQERSRLCRFSIEPMPILLSALLVHFVLSIYIANFNLNVMSIGRRSGKKIIDRVSMIIFFSSVSLIHIF